MSLLSARRSVRHFDAAPLPVSDIEAILDEARWAPSGGNDQPWQVTALDPQACAALRQRYEARAWRSLLPKLRRMVVRQRGPMTQGDATAAAQQMIDATGMARGAPWALLIHHLPERPRVRELLEGLDTARTIGAVEPVVRRDSVVCFAFAVCLAAQERGLGSCMQSMYLPFASSIARAAALPRGHELVSVVLVGRAADGARTPPRAPVQTRVVTALR